LAGVHPDRESSENRQRIIQWVNAQKDGTIGEYASPNAYSAQFQFESDHLLPKGQAKVLEPTAQSKSGRNSGIQSPKPRFFRWIAFRLVTVGPMDGIWDH
jgi:hypothetical protein